MIRKMWPDAEALYFPHLIPDATFSPQMDFKCPEMKNSILWWIHSRRQDFKATKERRRASCYVLEPVAVAQPVLSILYGYGIRSITSAEEMVMVGERTGKYFLQVRGEDNFQGAVSCFANTVLASYSDNIFFRTILTQRKFQTISTYLSPLSFSK